jgi:hypothetical protein
VPEPVLDDLDLDVEAAADEQRGQVVPEVVEAESSRLASWRPATARIDAPQEVLRAGFSADRTVAPLPAVHRARRPKTSDGEACMETTAAVLWEHHTP